ncbi:hypothetical protein [Minwuia sp.]|uniref:hypothetical protein n=1 Tax=Minwuia sp. TaxID=2493630 RepID=UPI003A924094
MISNPTKCLAGALALTALLFAGAPASAQQDPLFDAFTRAPATSAQAGNFFQIVTSNGKQVLGAERNYPDIRTQQLRNFAYVNVTRLGAQSFDNVPETYLRVANVSCPTTCFEIRHRSDGNDALLALTHQAITTEETKDAGGNITRLTLPAGEPAWYSMTDQSTLGESAIYAKTAVLMLVAHPSVPDRYVIRAFRDGVLTDQALRSTMADNLIFNYQKVVRARWSDTFRMANFDPSDVRQQLTLKRAVGELGSMNVALKDNGADRVSFTLKNHNESRLIFGGMLFRMNDRDPVSAFESTEVFLGFGTRLFERIGLKDAMNPNKIISFPWSIIGRPGLVLAVPASATVSGCEIRPVWGYPLSPDAQGDQWRVCRFPMATVAGLAYEYRFRSTSSDHRTWVAEVKPDGAQDFSKIGEVTFDRSMKIYGDATATVSSSATSSCADAPRPSLTISSVTTAGGVGTADLRGVDFGPCQLSLQIENDTVFNLGN